MDKDNLDNTNIASNLPFSQACENNKQPILEILQRELVDSAHVLEIGSGTGQHSVHFAPNLPHLEWQTSDVASNHSVIIAWHTAYPAINLHAPLHFDLTRDLLPLNPINNESYDAVFTANTLHIISWALVKRLFQLVGEALPIDGKLIVYGPFNDNGAYTSEGNRQFDAMLRHGNSDSGIRNKEDIVGLADNYGLTLNITYPMPANNQLLVFQKTKFH